MRYTLTLKQSLPYAQNPRFAELEGEKIICNDVILPQHIEKSYNPYNVRLWVIGHEFGAICAVFACCEQDALDEACDKGELDCMLSEEQDYDNEDLTSLGNASELFNLEYAWIAEVEFEPVRDMALIVALVRASVEGSDTLS